MQGFVECNDVYVVMVVATRNPGAKDQSSKEMLPGLFLIEQGLSLAFFANFEMQHKLNNGNF